MPFETRTRSTASSEASAAPQTGAEKGITAPSQRGQIQAIARVHSRVGYPASTAELVEAHGTSTKAGATPPNSQPCLDCDPWRVLWNVGAAPSSRKSAISRRPLELQELRKSVMALHHRTIPPSANFETPNPTVDWSNILVPTEPRMASPCGPSSTRRRLGFWLPRRHQLPHRFRGL